MYIILMLDLLKVKLIYLLGEHHARLFSLRGKHGGFSDTREPFLESLQELSLNVSLKFLFLRM